MKNSIKFIWSDVTLFSTVIFIMSIFFSERNITIMIVLQLIINYIWQTKYYFRFIKYFQLT